MTPYNGPERRTNRTDFERELIEFMASINTHMEGQAKRCDSHAADIRALDARQTIVEQAIQYEPEAPTIAQRAAALEAFRTWVLGCAAAITAVFSFGFAAFELWRFAHP